MQKILQFRVYNRWGETVFEADDIQPNNEQSGWDGIYKGEALKPDVYVYFVKAVCYTGEIIEIKGDVSLIR
jgi:gliding motility-associated-like protein